MSRADSPEAHDDPFAVMGVARDCTASELKQAYRLLARRYHPDVNPGTEAAAQMSRINRAYDRALEQIEKTVRRRSARISPMTVAIHQQPHTQPGATAEPTQAPNPGARLSPQSLHAPGTLRRSTRVRQWRAKRRRRWAMATAGLGAGTLIILVFLLVSHIVIVPWLAPAGAQAPRIPALRLGGATVVQGSGFGALTVSERLVAQFGSDMKLSDAPQWSSDGSYVAVSVAPAHNTTPATPTILVLQNARLLTTLPGIMGRWSPVADQLALLAETTFDNTPQLELVSPTALATPTILDAHAGTHLVWSADGTQIAYTANGQQQLRLASVADDSHQILVKARGQRLTPIGWQNGQIVEIVHDGSAVSLVGVDPVHGSSNLIATLDSLASEFTVMVSHEGVAYVSQAASASSVMFHWRGASQHWQAHLVGVQNVRYLAGWSPDGRWMALAPTPSNAGGSEICFAHAPPIHAHPPTQWPTSCLLLPGTLLGMSWEPRSGALSYVRAVQPGGAVELRELRIRSAQVQTKGAMPSDSHAASRLAVCFVACFVTYFGSREFMALSFVGRCRKAPQTSPGLSATLPDAGRDRANDVTPGGDTVRAAAPPRVGEGVGGEVLPAPAQCFTVHSLRRHNTQCHNDLHIQHNYWLI